MDFIVQDVENHRKIFCKKRTNHTGTRANCRHRDSQTSSKEELGVWLEREDLLTVLRALGVRIRQRGSKKSSKKRRRSSSGDRRKIRRRRLQQVQQWREGRRGRGEGKVQGRKRSIFLG